MYAYQNTNRYFAQVADDIKEIATEELQALGALETRPTYRGLYFTATRETLYRINFHSRLVNRVLAPLLSFNCHSDKYLYKTASQIPWQDFLDSSQTFAVFATVSHSAIKHSKFAALRLKDAIADAFRSRTGQRPSVDTKNPDVWFNLHIQNNEATISLDTSGGSLHRRGYRRQSVEAPMIETLAAAIIKLSDWDGSRPLYDPFCGSGTLLCEALMHVAHIPAAILRQKFGFERLPDFDAALWNHVKREGLAKINRIAAGLIAGSDLSAQAIKAASQNCAAIDRHKVIRLKQCDVFDIAKIEGQTVVCNPPYGIRMGKNLDLGDFYRGLGDFLKQRCKGSTAYIYFGERAYLKRLGLKPSWKKALSNGGLDGRLAMYELY